MRVTVNVKNVGNASGSFTVKCNVIGGGKNLSQTRTFSLGKGRRKTLEFYFNVPEGEWYRVKVTADGKERSIDVYYGALLRFGFSKAEVGKVEVWVRNDGVKSFSGLIGMSMQRTDGHWDDYPLHRVDISKGQTKYYRWSNVGIGLCRVCLWQGQSTPLSPERKIACKETYIKGV